MRNGAIVVVELKITNRPQYSVGDTVCVLPEGFRPYRDTHVVCHAEPTILGSSGFAHLTVFKDGTIMLNNAIWSPTAVNTLSIDGTFCLIET